MPVTQVTDQTFEREVLASELPVLIDLYADWCQPCKAIAPIVAQLSDELAGKIKFCKVDVDKSPRVAQSFRVQSVPMLVLLHEGRPVDQVVGAVDKKALLKMLEPVMPRDEGELAPKDLAALIAQKRVVPVDVRDANSFKRYRIPGAVNVTANDVVARASELAARDGRLRVLYGRTTDDAKTLAEQLRGKGVQVAYLAGGFLHWEADGLEVERGA